MLEARDFIRVYPAAPKPKPKKKSKPSEEIDDSQSSRHICRRPWTYERLPWVPPSSSNAPSSWATSGRLILSSPTGNQSRTPADLARVSADIRQTFAALPREHETSDYGSAPPGSVKKSAVRVLVFKPPGVHDSSRSGSDDSDLGFEGGYSGGSEGEGEMEVVDVGSESLG